MRENDWIAANIPNQTELAKIICVGDVTEKVLVRAHRIWHGARLHEEEIKALYAHTRGALDANKIYGLPTKKHAHVRKGRKQ
jgi:hypothetical protein